VFTFLTAGLEQAGHAPQLAVAGQGELLIEAAQCDERPA